MLDTQPMSMKPIDDRTDRGAAPRASTTSTPPPLSSFPGAAAAGIATRQLHVRGADDGGEVGIDGGTKISWRHPGWARNSSTELNANDNGEAFAVAA